MKVKTSDGNMPEVFGISFYVTMATSLFAQHHIPMISNDFNL